MTANSRRPGERIMDWVDEVLVFWFTTLDSEQWFKADPALDRRIIERFGDVHRLVDGLPDDRLLRDADTALAAVIVLDQFPRNMFRGTPAAFATDARALRLAEQAVDLGYDSVLPADRRIFLYLPFEHAEDAACQSRCIALVSALGNDELTRYAHAHAVIIERFGRFPHRNRILGRPSSAEELAFLVQPGSSF